MKKSVLKTVAITGVLLSVISAGACLTWLKVLPAAVKNPKVLSYVEKTVNKSTGADLIVQNPLLVTRLNPNIDFSVQKLSLSKNGELLTDVDNLVLNFSLKEIFKKVLIIKKLGVDDIFVDVNKITSAFSNPEEEKKDEKENLDFFKHTDLFDSVLYIKKSHISFKTDNDINIELQADNLELDNTEKEEKHLRFDFNALLQKNAEPVRIAFKDDGKVILKNKHIYVNGCPFELNKSKMFFNATAGEKEGFEVSVYAKRFFIPDIIKLLQTDIIESNINEILASIGNINGDIDFDFKIKNEATSGNIKVNKCSGVIIPVANMPFAISGGNIIIGSKDIQIKNLNGYYDNKKTNDFETNGTVKNYTQTANTTIDMKATLTNDLLLKYISKLAGVNIKLTSPSKALIKITTEGGKINIKAGSKVATGQDILIDGASLSPVSYDRALSADLCIDGDNLEIKKIGYYIAKEISRETGASLKPILTLDGSMRISDGFIKDLGFEIPNPLPSEFLNVLIGEKLFKGGKFSGNMRMVNTGEYPVLNGNMTAESVAIPSQRMFLKKGKITTDNNLIHFLADGGYRRCKYNFDAHLLNKLVFPIVVKKTSLTVDKIDIGNLIKSFSMPYVPPEKINNVYVEKEREIENPEPLEFDISNIIIKQANVKIIQGSYKNIEFADVEADMSLDKSSIFKLKSNKFEIAKGHSSADILCDLKNQKYNIKLGIKDVDSELIASSLLNLPREISGRASGLIDLNSDASLKLNGSVKFIIKEGTIQKIGLVEYVMKVASLFRNPFTMISPGVFSDLVNIPEGNFDKITGDMKLKNNIVEMMQIKSYSPSLSALIIGRYNTENSDAILRIYTKFTNKKKGIAGFLRNLSLNSLANRIPLSARNDVNYYAAELAMIPDIDADEKDCQIFLTKVDGDVEHNNFISSLKKIK